ncbi:hypothetical protein CP532_0683 [Ophiocordyceps camponoti-leonardi (nom. inval.)]|nr:hypothetical protein CP532_0683 [Ophiocordyceps camponoti-leonardi (nom. inval.)]
MKIPASSVIDVPLTQTDVLGFPSFTFIGIPTSLSCLSTHDIGSLGRLARRLPPTRLSLAQPVCQGQRSHWCAPWHGIHGLKPCLVAHSRCPPPRFQTRRKWCLTCLLSLLMPLAGDRLIPSRRLVCSCKASLIRQARISGHLWRRPLGAGAFTPRRARKDACGTPVSHHAHHPPITDIHFVFGHNAPLYLAHARLFRVPSAKCDDVELSRGATRNESIVTVSHILDEVDSKDTCNRMAARPSILREELHRLQHGQGSQPLHEMQARPNEGTCTHKLPFFRHATGVSVVLGLFSLACVVDL